MTFVCNPWEQGERFTNHDVFHGLVVLSFCSVLVPFVIDVKVLVFICVLAPAAQILLFKCLEADILSTTLLSNDFSCTWLEYKECKSVYASTTILVWDLECFHSKSMCDKTSFYFKMILSIGDFCCTHVALVVFTAYIFLHVMLPWRFHIAGKYVELSSAREHGIVNKKLILFFFGLVWRL